MAITFPIDVPLDNVTDFSWSEHNANQLQSSGFTGRGVVQEFEGDYWTATLRYRQLPRDLAQPVLGFASALRKSKGTFVLPFPGYSEPLGAAKDNPASPTVNGSGQAGSDELVIESGPVSITGWLLSGDIIQVGPASRPHWHRVLVDADTDVSGNATLDVWPRVREGTVDGDQISLSSPLCLFRLSERFTTDLTSPVIHSIELSCREAI